MTEIIIPTTSGLEEHAFLCNSAEIKRWSNYYTTGGGGSDIINVMRDR